MINEQKELIITEININEESVFFSPSITLYSIRE